MNSFREKIDKKVFNSRNRSLTYSQKSIFECYKRKLSIESFLNIKKMDNYKEKILEIGFGTGNTILESAKSNPESLYVGIEYYKKGIAQLLIDIKKNNLKNIRLFYGNAENFIKISDKDLFDEILIMFPDPWPKKKHWKRRFIQKDNIRDLKRVLRNRGIIYFFTDDQNLAIWGLRIFLEENLIWVAKKPSDCKINSFGYSESRYEKKAKKAKKKPYYFKFNKIEMN